MNCANTLHQEEEEGDGPLGSGGGGGWKISHTLRLGKQLISHSNKLQENKEEEKGFFEILAQSREIFFKRGR